VLVGKIVQRKMICLKKNRNIFPRSEDATEKDVHADWLSDISMALKNSPAMGVEGTQLNLFISSFVLRTKKMFKIPFGLSLLQEVVEKLCTGQLVRPQDARAPSKRQTFIRERAGIAYMLACAGQGAFMCNSYCPTMGTINYKKMKSALKFCYCEETAEVILANVTIAYCCLLSGKIPEFKKHSGFSRTLMQCNQASLPQEVTMSYVFIVLATEVLDLVKMGPETIKIFRHQFSIAEEKFIADYPQFHSFLEENVPGNSGIQDPETLGCLYGITLAGGNLAILTYGLVVFNFMKQVTKPGVFLGKQKKHSALNEVCRFMDLVVNFFCPDIKQSLLPFNHALLCLPQVLELIAAGNFVSAKKMLASVAERFNSYVVLTSMMLPGTEHVFHFLIVCLTYLEMDHEYQQFYKKVNAVCSVRQDALRLPETLPVSNHGLLNSFCEDICCQTLFQALPLLHGNDCDDGIMSNLTTELKLEYFDLLYFER